ncbi:MAG: PAS domain S-box protein [Paracoccaceae bacterium]
MMDDPISAVQRSKAELLELVIQTAPDAIITADGQGRILSFSPAAEKMFGYTEDEMRGRNLNCLMPEPYRSSHDGYLAHYHETGEKRIIGLGREVQAMRRNGEIFVAELAVGELSTGSAHVFTGFIRDVTDRVVAVENARRLQQKLDQVARVRMLGEMSTALAHEINQPLSAIANFARAAGRMLGDAAPDPVRAAAYVARVAEQAQRAGEIIRRMRRLVDRGEIDLKPGAIDEIIREAVSASHTSVRDDRLKVHLDFEPDLPKVMVDRIQIQQVIVNLLRNAEEAINEGAQRGPSVATKLAPPGGIKMRSDLRGGRVVVTVSDCGPGLSAEIAQTMFDPFVSTKPKGIGVGLAVCRAIILAHGGEIWAENLSQGGAAVHFSLLAAPDD